MKNYIILTLFLTPFILGVYACKKNNSKNCYNPPSWIIGTWKDTGAGGSNTIKFRFTEDDVIQTIAGSEVSNCTLNQSNGFSAVEEETDDIYSFKPSGTEATFYFQRISVNTIRVFQGTPPPNNTVYNELIRQ
jgi:hypothetical protein